MKTPKLTRPLLRPAILAFLAIAQHLFYPVSSSAAAGTVIAWRDNANGQTNVPPDLTNAVAVAAGASQSLAIRLDGTVSTWGGSSTALTNLPAGLSNVVQVAGGGTHSLALRADGRVVGWGDNYYPDTNSPAGQATPPADLANATAIAAGWAHSVALRYDRTVIAWGYNGSGQTNVPPNLGPVMAVAAGDWFSAALRCDGTVAVWGTNNLGQTNVPAGLSNVVAIAARGSTVLALKQNGRVVAWGGGLLGQTNVPADLTNAVAIAAGGGFELALRDDGRVTAWGDNGAGEIDGTAGLAQIVGLAAGGAHGVALLGDGSPRLTLQPRNQAASAGAGAKFVAKAVGDPTLSYQWFKDGLSLSDTTNCVGTATPTLVLTNLTTTNAGGYSLVVSNASGSLTSVVATLTILSPAVADSFNPGASREVYSLAVQPDGRVLVGGYFTTLGGQTRNYLGRLNADGSLDSSFNPVASGTVYSLAVQTDGKILVGGYFTSLGGQTRNYLGRLNADGSLDSTFNPLASSTVYSLTVQPDGKILVGGNFTTLGGQTRNYLGRLNGDGSLDPNFNPGANNVVCSLAVQADGKILVGGYFTTLGGQARNRIGRLNADGSLDTTFNPGASSSVYALAVQADARILVGGSFTTLGGQTRNYLGRLNADGSLDTSFNPSASSSVSALTVQADARILVGGNFAALGGQTRNYLGRLNADGSLDSSFNPGAGGLVYSLAVQPDGGVLVGGTFTTLGGQTRNYLGRLSNTQPATASLTFDSSTVTWMRGGTGPEVVRTTFEASTNGTDWISLGAGIRILGSWQLAGLSVPAPVTVRARGFYTGGQYNGSSWFVEGCAGVPMITRQPVSVSGFTNTAMGFSVVAAGTPPLAYQWCKNGAAIAGATNSAFTIQSSAASDAGSYQMVVGNGFGAVTSAVATLMILNPALPDAFNPGASSDVYSLAVQADGKILAGGSFSTLGGQTRSNLARLNPDGSLDTAFNPGSGGSSSVYVNSLALQADGKILVGGTFTTLGGQTRNYLGRLNADGSLDTTFNTGAGGVVNSLVVQADGKILVGGSFTSLAGQTTTNLGRLNADGSLDSSFNPVANFDVYSLAVQTDGKILVGGGFTVLGGQTRNELGRLNADGSLDSSFNPGANGPVYSLAVQADGRILVGGSFGMLGGQNRSYLGRLNADGSLDTSFNPGASFRVYSLSVQADGKILVGGGFTVLGGQTRIGIGRLNADGSLDATFNPGAGDSVYAITVQPDGSILLGGHFTTLGGQTRNHFGRLSNTLPATASLTFDGSTITWLRGGTGPEVWRTTFDTCTNGMNWISLGAGVRISGGWQLTGISLPSNSTIRARGFTAGGFYNGSGWFVETVFGAPLITCQPTNIANFTNIVMGFSVSAAGSPALAYQWYKNGAAVTGATNSAFTIQNSAAGDAGSYQVVVSNGIGAVTSAVAVLTILNPALPDAFNPGAGGVSYPSIRSLVLQSDGKVLMGGYFSTLAGQTCSNLGRLKADGSLEIALNAETTGSYLPSVYSLALQADGRILVGGAFTTLAGQPCTYLGRLNTDASLDISFNPYIPGVGQGVASIAVQPDGRILVGGNFTSLAGQARSYLGRLNADGSLDTTFNPGANNIVYSLAVQADGKILVGGAFTSLGGQTRSCIGRLNADGSLDTSFNPIANGTVYCVAVQADGRILLGGAFTMLAWQTRNYLGRVDAGGNLEAGFNPGAGGVSGPSVYSFALQTDGRILVGGYFATLAGQTRNYLGRLNADGSLDTTFNPGAGLTVASLAVQADGKILVGGAFTSLGGQTRNYIGRLNNTQPATESLGFDGSTVTWMRGGTGPEAWRTTFDASTNGADWISLGAGARIAGGWQQTGLALPANATIRARGFCTGGMYNSSSWYVETGLGTAAISQQPASRTNNPGTIAQFTALGAGAPPLGYQWCKAGLPLSDGGNLSGEQTATLMLTNVLGGDAGGYSVIISNSSGSITSLVATLTVLDPMISTQPVSQTLNAGASVLLSATAAGTAPLSYQWCKNGLSLADATAASLTLTNVQWADAGGFDLVVSNCFGAVTSAVATLSVNGPLILVSDGNCGLSTNGFGFNVGCMPGQTILIEVSSNLLNWVPVQTSLVTSAGVLAFTDCDTGNFPQRFYRAVLVP